MTRAATPVEQGLQAAETAEIVSGGRVNSARGGTHPCLACGERRARFSHRGVVKADRHHTLCFECYRAQLNRLRTRPVPSKLVYDRVALLHDLRLRRRRAQIAARHALEIPETGLAAEPLAS